jgi:peptidoglycan/xylan/chitin deacetylase (PgdA/CDA1 family)
VEIGSHTVSHAHLPELSDADLHRELRESREWIADELRRPCRFLAYPFGESDDRVHAAARVAGYEAAFSLRPKGQSALDRYSVPRVDVYRGDGWLRFRLKTSILHEPITGLAVRFTTGRHAGTA